MCDKPYLSAADSSKNLDTVLHDNPSNNQKLNTSSENTKMCDKPYLSAADSSKNLETVLYDNPSNNQKLNTSSENAEMCDKPYLSAADSSKNLEILPHDAPKNNQNLETPTDTASEKFLNRTFDKPYLFAADSSKKLETSPDSNLGMMLPLMTENIRKRRSITVKEKLEILNMVDSGRKLSAVAREFGISSSTASTIVKERYKIKMLSDHYNIDPERKRMRLGIYRDVDEAVHMWFKQMRMKNIPINGPMLQQKAREFAIQLGHHNFEGSSGWLFRFRERHGLSVKTMRDNDESAAYSCTGVGMTDDEIVTSVCQNTFNPLSFCDNKDNSKEKSCPKNSKKDNKECRNAVIKQDIPENYFVPEIELTDYEPVIGLPEVISLAEKLTAFLKDHDAPSDILKSMSTVSEYIDNNLREKLKQRKITDYFKP